MSYDDEVKSFVTPGIATKREIFEQVEGNHFLVWDRIEEKFIINRKDVWRHYVLDGVDYVPLSRLPWPTISGPSFYESEEQLFNKIRGFFVDHLDVTNDLFFDVYACFVMASWRVEDFQVVPYQFFIGPLASGKTRALECFHRLCYRSIMATSMSAASLFRAMEAWNPTLLLDETEIYNREAMVEVLALLNSGYRRGQYAIRVEKIEQGNPQVAMFDTFGFKVLAGTEELAATLQSRCIITPMSRAIRQVNLFIDEDKAQQLRNDLLFYRFKNLGKDNGVEASIDFIKENGYFRNARVIELFISLIQVAPTEEIKQRLIKCMKQITQSRLDEEQASIEARVFDAILKCEGKVESGKVSTQTITEAFNESLKEKEQVTSRFIGRKVSALGFEKCKLSGGGLAGYFWDLKLIERLKARYYPSKTTPQTPLTLHSPQTTETSALMEHKSGESGENSPELTHGSPLQISMKNGECGDNGESGVSLEALASKGKTLERLRTNFGTETCCVCGFKGRPDWQATLFDGSWGLLCGPCGDKLAKRLNKNEQ